MCGFEGRIGPHLECTQDAAGGLLRDRSSQRSLGGIRKPSRRVIVGAGSGLAAVAVAYGLAGFVLAPYVVGRALDRYAAQAPGRSLRVGHTGVNPFDLAVVLEQVSLRDAGAGVELRADRAVFNFGIAALFGRRVALDAVILERPDVSVTHSVGATGAGGFVDAWAARLRALSPPVSVGRLDLSRGHLALAAAPGLELNGVSLTAERFATDSGMPATYRLSFAEAGGARLRSQGRIGVAPPEASGRFELTGVDLGRIAAGRPAPAGELDARGAFRIAGTGGGRRATFTGAALSVRGLTWPFVGGAIATAETLGADVDADVTPTSGGVGVDARLTLDGRNLSVSDGGAAGAARLRFDDVSVDAQATYGPDRWQIDGSAEADGTRLERASRRAALFSVEHVTAAALSAAGSPAAIVIDDLRLAGLRTDIDAAPASSSLPPWLRAAVDPYAAARSPAPAPWRLAVGRVELDDASFDLTDSRFEPRPSIRWHDVNGELAGLGGDGTAATIELEGTVGAGGSARVVGRLQPAGSDGFSRFDVRADDVEAAPLSPYALRFAARPLRSGTLSGALEYRISDNRLEGSLRVASSELDIGPAVAGAPGPSSPLPLALAAALLEDPAGRLELSVPLAAPLQRPDAYVPAVVGEALAAAVSRTAAEPFDALGRIVGAAAPMLASVPFAAGSAEITAQAAMRLSRLAAALQQRPKLALTVVAGFDRKLDRDALAAQQIRLHVALATAGATQFSPAQFGEPPPIDFASPRAQDVLDEFAGERLDAERVQTIASLFPGSAATDPAAREDYYRALFDALVAQESITDAALTRLGRYRAQSIVDTLRRLDVDAARLRPAGAPAPAAVADDAVLVPLGVMAFETRNGGEELGGRVEDR